MRKLALKVDALRVSSFDTGADGGRERGTVAAANYPSNFDATCIYATADYHSCPAGASNDFCGQLYEDTDMRMCCTVERCSAAGMCW